MKTHLIKLAVGIDHVGELHDRQAPRIFDYNDQKATLAWTKRKPKAEEALLDGGSIYWVVRNYIQVRQRILGFESYESDTGTGWRIILDPQLIMTVSAFRKPFQGWRYLTADMIPGDDRPYHPGEARIGTREIEDALRQSGLI